MASLDGASGGGRLQIHLLGRFQVAVDGRVVPNDAWRRSRAATLIKILALSPHHRAHRDQLMEILWPDTPPERAANSIHQALHLARRILEPNGAGTSSVRLSSEIVSLAPDAGLWTDVDAFEEAATRAAGSTDTRRHRAALELYAGDLLPDDLYQEWTVERREALRNSYLRVTEEFARLAEAGGDLAAAIRAFEEIVRIDPVREDAHTALIRLYALSGRRHDALRQYELLEQVLREELGVGPEPEASHLYGEILKGSFVGSAGRAANPLPSATLAPGNLPQEVNRFVGRGQEVAELRQMLASAHVLTLTGTGGCGKTRLAVHLAQEMRDGFSDGAWMVELAGLRNPLLVPQAVASVLDLPERSDRSLTETLAEHLRQQQVLLVLDNCEHLIGAVATLADRLVAACPSLRILATSREPLHIPGEVVWRVSSLSVPDPHEMPSVPVLGEIDAVALFLDRARAVMPGFELTETNAPAIARICYRLDGIPLAIELAAARVGALSVGQILDLLDDCFALLTSGSRTALSRQQTLKALLDWSHDLLTEDERALFCRLAVFAGGFSFDAADSVGGGQTLVTLMGLVDKSLVQAERHEEEIRYRLLEPVRQYAHLHFLASGESGEAYRAHALWYADLARRADQGLWGATHGAWIEQLEREHDNLRAILGRCGHGEVEIEVGLHLVDLLWQFWLLGGYLTEGRNWIERLLAQNPPISVRKADALMHASGLAVRQGDYSPGIMELIQESFAIYHELGEETGRSQALRAMAAQAYVNSEYETAEAYLREGKRRAPLAGRQEHALAVHSLGIVAWGRGEYEEARALLEEARELFESLEADAMLAPPFLNVPIVEAPYRGMPDVLSMQEETWVMLRRLTPPIAATLALVHIGTIDRAAGETEAAYRHLRDAVHAFRRRGDRAGLSQALSQLGNLYRAAGQYDAAREALYESLDLRRELRDRRGVGRSLNNLGVLALFAGNMRRAHALFEESMALFQSMNDRPGMAATHENQGHEALLRGCWTEATAAYQRGIELTYEMGGVKREHAFDLRHIGLAAIGAEEYGGAAEALRRSRELYAEMSDTRSVVVVDRLLASDGIAALALRASR